METAKLTLRLPKQDLDFAERYARAHRITLSELVDRYLRRLRLRSRAKARPEPEGGDADAWQKLLRVGDALAAGDPPDSPTLTSALLAMRR